MTLIIPVFVIVRSSPVLHPDLLCGHDSKLDGEMVPLHVYTGDI